jgi:hypothetical protein
MRYSWVWAKQMRDAVEKTSERSNECRTTETESRKVVTSVMIGRDVSCSRGVLTSVDAQCP